MAFGQVLGYIGMVAGAVVGGVIGSIFPGIGTVTGATIGASLGGMLGGIAGQVFFPELADLNLPPPPQPHETRTQVSTYGAPIPIVYESGRLAGNIIYMQDINQTVTRTSHRQDGVRYYEITSTYAATFAIAFCEGPVSGISRIWVNHKIFADFRDPAGEYYPAGSVALATANLATSIARNAVYFTTYLGTETQTADPTLVSLLTDAETPAYRGVCYIVFIDFPVGEFSGLPLIEVEIGPQMADACSEYFIGADGSDPSQSIYTITYEESGLAPKIASNMLVMATSNYSAGEYFEVYMQSNFTFLGEFDVVIDFDVVYDHLGPAFTNDGYIYLYTGLDSFVSYVWNDSYHVYECKYYNPGTGLFVYQAVATSVFSGKLRITRNSSNNLYFYVWNATASQWEWNGDTNGLNGGVTSDPCVIYVDSFTEEGSKLSIDNITTVSGCDNIQAV